MLVILVAAAKQETKVTVFLNDRKGVSWASDLPGPSICILAPAVLSLSCLLSLAEK